MRLIKTSRDRAYSREWNGCALLSVPLRLWDAYSLLAVHGLATHLPGLNVHVDPLLLKRVLSMRASFLLA